MNLPRTFLSLSLSLSFFLVLLISAENACTNPVQNCDPSVDYFLVKFTPQYSATIQNLQYHNTYVDFQIKDLDRNVTFSHRLIRCGCPHPDNDNSSSVDSVLFVPPVDLHTSSTPVMAILESILSLVGKLRSVADPMWISSEVIRNRVQVGLIVATGWDYANLLNKSIIDPPPTFAVVDVYNLDQEVPSYQEQTQGSIPFIAFADSAETTPLGRAEFALLIGLIFDELQTATQKFEEIIANYQTTKKLAIQSERRPSVLVNYEIWGSWATIPGDSYMMQFLRDANADYRFSQSTLPQYNNDTETLKYFQSADVWINSNPLADTTQALLDTYDTTNQLSAQFEAVKCARVYNNGKRGNPNNPLQTDFYELAVVRPDYVLKDLLKIFHPHIDFDHQLLFYTHLAPSNSLQCPLTTLPVDQPTQGNEFVFINLKFEGADRFTVEDNQVFIVDTIARTAAVDKSAIQLYVTRHEEAAPLSYFVSKFMVPPNQVTTIMDGADNIAAAVQTNLEAQPGLQQVSVSVSGEPTTTAPDNTPPSGSNSLSTAEIAGIVIGIIVGVALIVAITAYFSYKKGLKEQAYSQQNMNDDIPMDS